MRCRPRTARNSVFVAVPDQRRTASQVLRAAPHPGHDTGKWHSATNQDQSRRKPMNKHIRKCLLASAAVIVAAPAYAAEVTPDRLANPDKEPHNWLMNHRTYDAQRYSPLDKINKSKIKNLKLAYAVAIGGTSANRSEERRVGT